jgi:hypothetical protein
MKVPETNPDIDIILRLNRSNHTAYWLFKDGRHSIILNPGNIFEKGKAAVDKSHDYPGASPVVSYSEDQYIDAFMDTLAESFLAELVCIERRRQGLRMKFKRCEPCCLARVVAHMVNHCHICLCYKTLPIKAGVA